MQNRKVFIRIFISTLCLLIFISCKTDVNTPIAEYTVHYISEFGQIYNEERIFQSGYILQSTDLVTLTSDEHEFIGWYDKNSKVEVGKKITKDTVLIAKWEKMTNHVIPNPITDISYKNLNGIIALRWKNPSNKDLFGIEINYRKKINGNQRNISPLENNTIMVAPNAQYIEITNLELQIPYIFTLRAVDLLGNKSKDAIIECTPFLTEGEVMNINLTSSIDYPTNKSFFVNIDITSPSPIKTVKFSEGNKQADFFIKNGTNAILDNKEYKFEVLKNGLYTVFVQDLAGRRELKTIFIDNIDLTKPDPVINLKSKFEKHNEIGIIQLFWEHPNELDIDKTLILDNDNNLIATVGKNIFSHSIENIPVDGKNYTFNVITRDLAGNTSEPVSISIIAGSSIRPKFASFTIPKVSSYYINNTIEAIVKGENFITSNIPTSEYTISCDTDQNIINNKSISIIDDTTIKFKLNIPSDTTSNNYKIILSCNDNTIYAFLNISNYSIGDIIMNDGTFISCNDYMSNNNETPIAIISAFTKDNKPIGIGLNQSDCLPWAKNFSQGYTTSFDEIVCTTNTTPSGETSISGDLIGFDNWDYICKKETMHSLTPQAYYQAFNYAITYGTYYELPQQFNNQWFIPSLYELNEIYKNKDTINKSLSKVGGIELGDYDYWSSNQDQFYRYAWYMNFYDGSMITNQKYFNKVKVLPVKIF